MQLLNFFQIIPIKALHDAIAECIARLHNLSDLSLDAGRLQFDIQPTLPAGNLKHFIQRRNPLALDCTALEFRARIESLELLERQLRDLALAVGSALDSIVMDNDDGAVARELHIELAHIRTRIDGGAERAQGILGKSTARPAMGYVKHSPPPPR